MSPRISYIDFLRELSSNFTRFQVNQGKLLGMSG